MNTNILTGIGVMFLVCACATAADLPPDAEGAPAALAKSTRHGEWVDIPLPGSEVKLKTWVVYPERADAAPVVLVIHEIYGMSDWIRGVTDALAAQGYVAVAPDLLSGMGPDGGGTESLGDRVRSEIRKLTPADTAARLNAVRDYAVKLSSTTEKVGCVGFCWGGSTSFNYAARQAKLDAAVVFYGTGPTDQEELAAIKAPVLGFYGGDDARVTSTVEATTQLMKKLDKPYTPHVYAGAGHGFLRQQSGRDGANRKASVAAWSEMLAFYKKHLSKAER